LEELRQKPYLTEEEQFEQKRIQKQKLAGKDRIMEILARYRQAAARRKKPLPFLGCRTARGGPRGGEGCPPALLRSTLVYEGSCVTPFLSWSKTNLASWRGFPASLVVAASTSRASQSPRPSTLRSHALPW